MKAVEIAGGHGGGGGGALTGEEENAGWVSGLEGEGELVALGSQRLPAGPAKVPPHVLPAPERDLLHLQFCRGNERNGLTLLYGEYFVY